MLEETLYYKCPKCGRICKNGSLITYTFGRLIYYYSDGKLYDISFPRYPEIKKCNECKTFYWLNKENEIQLIEKQKNENIDKAYLLSVNEYKEIINSKFYKDIDELKYFRIKLWQTFNEYHRLLSIIEKWIYRRNCLKLIKILDKNIIHEKIMIAELYRNIGQFTKCKNILNTIDEKYKLIKDILGEECVEKNKYRVIIQQ